MNDIIVKPNILKLNSMKMKKKSYLCTMKTMGKKSRALGLLSLYAAIMLLPLFATAQVKTYEVQNLSDVKSIVRETGNGYWLVCNYSSGISRFSLVDENQPLTQQLQLSYVSGADSLCVNDFEIYRDTVFFCGQTWSKEKSTAIWGYFPLMGFPNVTVKYSQADVENFKKLDVFSANPSTVDLHVVMVGGTASGDLFSPIAYDEVRVGTDAFKEYSLVDHFGNYSDVAISDSNVVFACVDFFSSYLEFINKPATLMTTIFSSSAISRKITSIPVFSIILEYCKNNAVVAVYNMPKGPVYVNSYIGTVPDSWLCLIGSNIRQPRDVKFDKVSENLDVLTSRLALEGSCVDSSTIYHLNQSLRYYGGPIFGHRYNKNLNSLEWLSNGDRQYVASGHECGPNILQLCKYRIHDWNECTRRIVEETKGGYLKDVKYEIGFSYKLRDVTMDKMESYDLVTPVKVVCE